jgi:tRNA pseudouridine38-40 synthase
MSRRLKLTLAYDGTDFFGWQVQPDLPTIQGTLEAVFAEIEKSPVHVAGSGRTDAGVHALAQVAAVTIDNPIPLDNLRRAVNRLLPPSIRLLAVEAAPDNFNPRHDATSKMYEYRLFRGEVCPPFERRYVHHHPYPLDEPAMHEAAALLEGEHDFTAFAAADERDALGRSKVRRIFRSELIRGPDRLLYRVTGSGFLKHMVRNIVGTLIEAGKGNCDRERLRRLLTAPAGVKAGPTAPACGLFLVRVTYENIDPAACDRSEPPTEDASAP